jgi:hypothetical protein
MRRRTEPPDQDRDDRRAHAHTYPPWNDLMVTPVG